MYFGSAQLILVSPFLNPKSLKQLTVAVNPDDGKEGSEPHGQICRIARSHAQAHAGDEPGKARRKTRPYLSASSEIRERDKPYWRQPAPAHRANPQGAGGILL